MGRSLARTRAPALFRGRLRMIPAGAEGSDEDDAVHAAGWIRACRRAGSQGA